MTPNINDLLELKKANDTIDGMSLYPDLKSDIIVDGKDLFRPAWMIAEKKKREADKLAREQEKVIKEEAVTATSPDGVYLPSADKADPFHPDNFFSEASLRRQTVDERRERFAVWRKAHAQRFLTPEGIKAFSYEATLPDNRLGLAKNSTVLEGATDIGKSLGQGIIGAGEGLTSLFGADNSISTYLRGLNDSLQKSKSQGSQIDAAALQAQIKEAENMPGMLPEVKAYLNVLATQPLETIAQGLGSLVTAGAGKVAQLLKATGKAVTAVNVGVGAAQGVGATKSGIYEQVEKLALESGKSPDEAKRLAAEAQSYKGDNLAAFIAAAGLGAVASNTGAEKALVQGAKQGVIKAGTTEAVTEASQDAQQKLAVNDASINIGVMADEKRFSGLAGSAALAGATGGLIGAGLDLTTSSPTATDTKPAPPGGPVPSPSATQVQDVPDAFTAEVVKNRQTALDTFSKSTPVRADGETTRDFRVRKHEWAASVEQTADFTEQEKAAIIAGSDVSAVPPTDFIAEAYTARTTKLKDKNNEINPPNDSGTLSSSDTDIPNTVDSVIRGSTTPAQPTGSVVSGGDATLQRVPGTSPRVDAVKLPAEKLTPAATKAFAEFDALEASTGSPLFTPLDTAYQALFDGSGKTDSEFARKLRSLFDDSEGFGLPARNNAQWLALARGLMDGVGIPPMMKLGGARKRSEAQQAFAEAQARFEGKPHPITIKRPLRIPLPAVNRQTDEAAALKAFAKAKLNKKQTKELLARQKEADELAYLTEGEQAMHDELIFHLFDTIGDPEQAAYLLKLAMQDLENSGKATSLENLNKNIRSAMKDIYAYQDAVERGEPRAPTDPALAAETEGSPLDVARRTFEESAGRRAGDDPEVVSQALTETAADAVPGLSAVLYEKGPQAALQYILDNDKPSAFTRGVIAAIKPFIGSVTVTRVRPIGIEEEAFGAYSPFNRQVWVRPGETSAHTVIHELVHAAVDTLMHTAPASLSPRQRKAAAVLNTIYVSAMSRPEFSGRYATTSVHEFIAEAMSNLEVQILLDRIPVEQLFTEATPSLWQAFKESVMRILGLEPATLSSSLLTTRALLDDLLAAPTPRKSEVLALAPVRTPRTRAREPILKRFGLSVAKNFVDHGAPGMTQVLDEQEMTTDPDLKEALEDFRQKFTLRDVAGQTQRIVKLVADPVERLINTLAAQLNIDPNALRNSASEYQISKHSLQQTEVKEAEMQAMYNGTETMLKYFDEAEDIRNLFATKVKQLTLRFDEISSGEYILRRGWTQQDVAAERQDLVDTLDELLANFSAELAGIDPDGNSIPSRIPPDAHRLINEALSLHRFKGRTFKDSRKAVEAAKVTLRSFNAFLGARKDVEHLHQEHTQLKQDWEAAQTQDRIYDGIDDGRTVGNVALPGGLRKVEALKIMEDIEADKHADAVRQVAEAYKDAFAELTDEAVRTGVMPAAQALDFMLRFPEYVNIQGDGDKDIDDNFLERNYKDFLHAAEGARHYMPSNDIFSNLNIRAQKLATSVANQSVGESMLRAFKKGSKLFTVQAPDNSRNNYVGFQNGNERYNIVGVTDEINSMLGPNPGAKLTPWLGSVSKITTGFGRMYTHWTALFAPISFARDVITRNFNLIGRKNDLVDVNGRRIGVQRARFHVMLQMLNPLTFAAASNHAVRGVDSETMARFVESGGYQTFSETLRNERQVIDKFAPSLFRRVWEPISGIVHKWNQSFETAVVLGQFKGLIDAGMTDQQAAFVTLDSMNFRKAGVITASHIKPFYMFANATAQDAIQLKRSFINRGKINYQAIAEVLTVATLAAMVYSTLRAADDDDELGGKAMDSLSQRERRTTMLVPLGGGEYLKIPIGFGAIATAWQIGVSMVEVELGQTTQADAILEAAGSVLKNFAITGGSEVAITKDPFTWFTQTLSPDLFAGILAVSTNKNFMGGEIANKQQEGKFKSESGRIKTDETYKDWAVEIRKTIGMDIAPEHVKTVAEAYMPGLFAVLLEAGVDSKSDKIAKGGSTEAQFDAWQRALGISRLAAKSNDVKQIQTQFYLEKTKAEEWQKELNAALPKTLKRESPAEKLDRYAAAGATDEQLQALTALVAYDDVDRDISEESTAMYELFKQGQDVSVEMQAINEKQLKNMKTFVLSKRGIQ